MVFHKSRIALAIVLAVVVSGGCSGSSPSPAPSTVPIGSGSSDVIQITGQERFGWNQAADDVSSLHFALLVDAARVDVSNAACHAAATAGTFDCDAALPPLTPGRHALELVAVVTAQGQSVDSPPTPALNVNVTPGTGQH